MSTRRYYVCDTKGDAEALERLIRDRGFALAQQAGRYVSVDGLASERLQEVTDENGEPTMALVEDRSTQRTKAWTVPVEDAAGNWLVLHPDAHPAGENPAYLAFVTDGITNDIIEADDVVWPATPEA